MESESTAAATIVAAPGVSAIPSHDGAPPRIGRYEIGRQLGHGGLGVVYEAFDPDLRRPVAIKLIRLDRHHGPMALERLRREAEALARLNHPNIVTIYDVGTWALEDGRPSLFIVMEKLEGKTLTRWCRRDEPTWTEIIAAYAQAAEGLIAAHDAGVVHRDFKPSNVIRMPDGHCKVLDFGLAKFGRAPTDPTSTASFGGSDTSADPRLTETGVIMGTLAYMSPEQLRTGEATPASDQFSLCVSLYEALYGRRPFLGRTSAQLMHSIAIRGPIPPPAGTPVPLAIRVAVARGLLPRPNERWPDLRALLRPLSQPPRPRRRMVAVAAMAIAAIGLASVAAARAPVSPACPDGEQDCLAQHSEADEVSPEVLLQQEKIRGLLQRADDKSEAGEFEAGLALVHRAHTEAEELGDEPLVVESLHEKAEILRAADKPNEAADAAEEAFFVAKEAGRDSTGLRIASLLVIITGRDLASAVKADQWIQHGLAVRDRGSADIASQAAFADAVGTAMTVQTRYEEGLKWHEEALALLRQVHDENHLNVLATRTNVALSMRWLGRNADAEREYRDIARRFEEIGGPDLPRLGHTLHLLATVVANQGRFDEAIELYERALTINRAAKGEEHEDVVQTYNNLGTTVYRQGNYEAALEYFERVAEIDAKKFGADHSHLIPTYSNIALTHDALGQRRKARQYFVRADAIAEASLPPGHGRRERTRMSLAQFLFDHAERGKALRLYREALQAFETTAGKSSPAVLRAHRRLGSMLLEADRPDEALPELEAAMRGLAEMQVMQSELDDLQADLERARHP